MSSFYNQARNTESPQKRSNSVKEPPISTDFIFNSQSQHIKFYEKKISEQNRIIAKFQQVTNMLKGQFSDYVKNNQMQDDTKSNSQKNLTAIILENKALKEKNMQLEAQNEQVQYMQTTITKEKAAVIRLKKENTELLQELAESNKQDQSFMSQINSTSNIESYIAENQHLKDQVEQFKFQLNQLKQQLVSIDSNKQKISMNFLRSSQDSTQRDLQDENMNLKNMITVLEQQVREISVSYGQQQSDHESVNRENTEIMTKFQLVNSEKEYLAMQVKNLESQREGLYEKIKDMATNQNNTSTNQGSPVYSKYTL